MNWVERIAVANGLESAKVKRIQLAIEELFTNTILHGHGMECDATIELALNIDASRVKLTYSDGAKRFDPRAAAPLPASSERMGGVGLNLIRAFTRSFLYRYQNGRNILELEFPTSEESLLSD